VEDVGAVEIIRKLLTSGVGVGVFDCLGIWVYKLSIY